MTRPMFGRGAPDAVVVGAGHNGLVAANLLVDAGWDVIVCETSDEIGGAVRSAAVTAPGFQSDLFSAFYPFGAASPVLNSLDLNEHGLRWSHAPHVLAHVFPDDRCSVLSRDRHATAASVNEFADGDGAAWLKLVQQWDDIGELVVQALFQPFPPVRAGAALLRRLGTGPALRLARMAVLPVRRFGEENFTGPGGPMLIAGNAAHADLSPDSPGSALYGWLLAMLGQSVGFPVPVGGAGMLSNALASRLTSRGGQIRTDSEVEQVTVAAGAATGVILSSGEVVPARRAVLADVDAPTLFSDLLDPSVLPAQFLHDLAHFQWDLPTVKIDWALSSHVPWIAADAGHAGTVHLGVDMNGLTDYSSDLATGRLPLAPLVLVGQMSTADPTRSPAGTESLWAYTHLPRHGKPTDEQLHAHLERIEQLLERHAPGFRELIIGRHVQTPSSLQRADRNLHNGAINGGTAQLHQQLVFRPAPGLGGAATPIDRLYLAGSSAHPGGGVHGGPGANAAAAALARVGISGTARWKATRALMRQIYRPDSPPSPR
jgi:phytoene dehydrogenase-like protein